MTSDDDFIGQLEDYLESFDGTTPLPDRVRDAVHAGLPSTRQVNSRLGLLRRTNMSTPSTIVRWGLLAAALVVIALAATVLLPGGTNRAAVTRTAAPTAAPTPTATRVSTPQVLAAAPPGPCGAASPGHNGCIPAGTYELGSAVPGGLIDVPSGWFEWDPGSGSVGLLVDQPDIEASGWGVIFIQVGDVARDPCRAAAGTYPTTQVDTPQELAAAMRAWPGFVGTSPQVITIGGVAGVRTRLTWSKAPTACPKAMVWRTPAGTPIDAYPMVNGGSTRPGGGYPADFSLIEIDGQIVAIRTMASAGTSPNERVQGIAEDPKRHEADLVTLQTMLDSIRFEGGGS